MDAAPHLFDDALVSSPELALVDTELAARLRAEFVPDEVFQPRLVDRGDFDLRYDNVVVLASPDFTSTGQPAALEVGGHGDVDSVEVEPSLVGLVVEPALSTFSYLSDARGLEDGEPLAAGPVDDDLLAPEPAFEPEPRSEDAEPAVELDAEGPMRGLALELAPEDAWDLPDYVVRTDEVGDSSRADDSMAIAVDADADEGPALALEADDHVVGGESADSEYPELPDLTAASAALEETDAALRRIREQLVREEPKRNGAGLRRAMVVSGIGALGAGVIVAVDVQLGLATLPSWLGF